MDLRNDCFLFILGVVTFDGVFVPIKCVACNMDSDQSLFSDFDVYHIGCIPDLVIQEKEAWIRIGMCYCPKRECFLPLFGQYAHNMMKKDTKNTVLL